MEAELAVMVRAAVRAVSGRLAASLAIVTHGATTQAGVAMGLVIGGVPVTASATSLTTAAAALATRSTW